MTDRAPLLERLERPIPRYEQDVRIVEGRVLANPDGPEAAVLIRELSERIAVLEGEVARRGMALAPFAEACSNCIDDEPDDDSTWEHPVGMEVTFRDFREASASLIKEGSHAAGQ